MECRAFHCEPVRGASHVKADLPCEDSGGSIQKDRYKAVAVSDGHGSDNNCRSSIGSRLAVECILESICETIDAMFEAGLIDDCEDPQCNKANLEKVLNDNVQLIKKKVIAKWDDAVREHVRRNPYDSSAEYKHPDEQYDQLYTSGEKLERMYGATVEAAVVGAGFWFILQLGDGVASVRDNEGWSIPISGDELIGERVNSICGADAIDHFKSYVAVGQPPQAVFITTDGIDKAYANYDLQFGFYDAVIKNCFELGIDETMGQIGDGLYRISEYGSSDDIAFAVIMRTDVDWTYIIESTEKIDEEARQSGDGSDCGDEVDDPVGEDGTDMLQDVDCLATVDKKEPEDAVYVDEEAGWHGQPCENGKDHTDKQTTKMSKLSAIKRSIDSRRL